MEQKPNHIRHVEHQIEYTNAVCQSTMQQMQEWVKAEVPKMVQVELGKTTIHPKVDDNSLADVKRKITDMLKSVFH